MSDQQPPANTEDSAAVAGPNEAPGAAQEQSPQYSRGQEDVDWHKRYVDTQADYTRQQQEFAQKQQWYELLVTSDDPDTRRQAAEVLGYQLPEEEEEPEPTDYEDPYEALRADVDSVRQRQEQAEQAAQEAQEGALIQAISNERMEALGITDAEDQNLVLAYAINALPPVHEPGMPVPLPDVKAAVEFIHGRDTRQMKNWAKTKRSPFVSSGGRDATEAPVLGPNATHEQRVAFAAQKYQELVGDE